MVKLVDTYCRKIDYLRISITDRCNLDCLYQKAFAGRTIDDLVGIFRAAAAVKPRGHRLKEADAHRPFGRGMRAIGG